MVYHTTLAPLFTLRREMDRVFEDAFGRGSAEGTWSPAVDVRETRDAWHFELELPGVNPEQVEVTAESGVLTVRGEKAVSRRNDQDGRWHIVERQPGRFQRSFQLPGNVNEDGIEASFAQGLLTVRVPKAELPKPRRIEVRA